MRVLLACEESQEVCREFRRRGHEAYSCDLLPCSGGHPETKATCLWLKGLPPLVPTNDVREEMFGMDYKDAHRVHSMPPGPERSRMRSRTYHGIAVAMAEQWGGDA